MSESKHRYTVKIAEILKSSRKQAELSSRELATRVGSSHSTILAYENGRKVPSTTTFLRLIHACGFSVDFLLSPRIRGDESNPRGDELEAVLNLAAEFPTRHSQDSGNPNPGQA